MGNASRCRIHDNRSDDPFYVCVHVVGAGRRTRAGGWVERLQAGFRRNAFAYLLARRPLALFPFIVMNIAPPLLEIPLRAFPIDTLLGIIPGSFVYASVGPGRSSLFDSSEINLPLHVPTRQVMAALFGHSQPALLPTLHGSVRRPGAAATTIISTDNRQ
ncbi:MAG: VTT domain-containing protein [Proteobacteria bacterium]|nr:VTT domain-containing protein [Pseudomonadota bacterium]